MWVNYNGQKHFTNHIKSKYLLILSKTFLKNDQLCKQVIILEKWFENCNNFRDITKSNLVLLLLIRIFIKS